VREVDTKEEVELEGGGGEDEEEGEEEEEHSASRCSPDCFR